MQFISASIPSNRHCVTREKSQARSTMLDIARLMPVAEENLRLGRTVVADSVNPLAITRNAWVEVAKRAQALAVEVEVRCSDANEHRRRVETRTGDMPGLRLPTWGEVAEREYHPWDRDHLVIDTAADTAEQAVQTIRTALENAEASFGTRTYPGM